MTYDHFNLIRRIGDVKGLTAIDFGCGAYASDIAKQVLELPFKRLVSVDGYKKDLEDSKSKPCIIEQHDFILSNIIDITDEEKFDVGLAFDVIEHLTKEQALEFLNLLDRKITKQIVLFLPEESKGFHRPNPDKDNILQEHLSYWSPDELEKLGYKTERMINVHSDFSIEENRQIYFNAIWAIKYL